MHELTLNKTSKNQSNHHPTHNQTRNGQLSIVKCYFFQSACVRHSRASQWEFKYYSFKEHFRNLLINPFLCLFSPQKKKIMQNAKRSINGHIDQWHQKLFPCLLLDSYHQNKRNNCTCAIANYACRQTKLRNIILFSSIAIQYSHIAIIHRVEWKCCVDRKKGNWNKNNKPQKYIFFLVLSIIRHLIFID